MQASANAMDALRRPILTPITEHMHVAAARVLVRASGLDGTPQRMLDAMLATQPAEIVASQALRNDESAEAVSDVFPPRPAGYNGADTDPTSPLERWGKPRHEGHKLLLQPIADGYWTPWHIANAMLRAAQAESAEAGAVPDGWQDISTAPKDGTEFLIRQPSLSGPLVAYYLEPEHTDWDGAEFYETWSHDPIYDATQWHALPPAPTARPLPAPPAPEALEVP